METGTTHWIESWGTNETGFTSLPGGQRSSTGIYSYIGEAGFFWSSRYYPGTTEAFYLPIPASKYYHDTPSSTMFNMGIGFSIRCLKN